MPDTATPRTDPSADAHLLIHADAPGDHRRRRASESPLQRLLALYSDGADHDRASLRIEIHDLKGHRILTVDDASPLLDVSLPAGTYHVSTQLGPLKRGYTMSLQAGGAFDLYLRLAAQPAS
jgi:hypothetical protein